MTTRDHASYVTAAGAAAILHVSAKTVARWAKEGRLPHTKTLGGHRRFDEAQLRALMASLRVEAQEVAE
jgi:excisionase family DNA binding protein